MITSDDTDYTLSPVASHDQTGSLGLAAIIIGGTIAVPGFLMSAQVSSGVGFYDGILSFVIGCQVLAILGVLTAKVGADSKLSTYLILRFVFGRVGYRYASLLIAGIMLFWFAVLCNLFGHASRELVIAYSGASVSPMLYAILGGIGMVCTTIFGFVAVQRMAQLVVPLLAALLLYGAYAAVSSNGAATFSGQGSGALSIGAAISIVIGAYSGGIVTLPDYVRFARHPKRALWAVYFSLGISFPIVLTITAIPSVVVGNPDLLKIFLSIGLGAGALLILLFSTVSSNVAMLYSAGLAVSASLSRSAFSKSVSVLGFSATLVGLFDVVNLFVPYVSFLGISVPSLCGIYVYDYLITSKRNYDTQQLRNLPNYNASAIVCWMLGFMIGVASLLDIVTFTSVAALDSIFAAAISYAVLARQQRRDSVA